MNASPSGAKVWLLGARPRTLGAAIAPVAVGTAAAGGHATASRALVALVVALGMQVGVNYANDYYDGVRGIDTARRVGPVRITAAKLASPRAVATAAAVSFAIALAAGAWLAWVADALWLVGVGLVAVIAAVSYSGGPKPYASKALGELSVFVFFGIVATVGTTYVQAERVTEWSLWGAMPVGLLAVAILLANNIRDIPTDTAAGKRTLAVRLGDDATRSLYRAVVIAALLVPPIAWFFESFPLSALIALAATPLAVRPLRAIGTARGPELIPVLLGTAALHLAFGLLLAVGLWVS